MESKTIIVIALAALVLISIVQAVEIASVKSKMTGTGNSLQSAQSSEEQSYEEMMAEMHPELATSKQTSSSGNIGTMVGGC